MLDLYRLWFGARLRLFRTRRSLMLENLALRQQLAVLKRKHPRPRLAQTGSTRQALLGHCALLVSMERHAPSRPAGDGRSVAPSWIQTLLGHALQGAKARRRGTKNL